MKKKKKTLSN